MRHFSSGIDCAIAGAASVAAPAAPIPVTLRKSLRFMNPALVGCLCDALMLRRLRKARPQGLRRNTLSAFLARPDPTMVHPPPDFHPEPGAERKKARPLKGA